MLDAFPPPDRGGDPDAGEPWELEDVYDPETLALIEQAPPRVSAERRGPSGTEGITVLPAAELGEPLASTEDDPDRRAPDRNRRLRSGTASLLMAGMMTGVGEVLDPEQFQPEMVEFTPDQPDPEGMPVQFVMVPGSPTASRIIVRPWLFGRRRG